MTDNLTPYQNSKLARFNDAIETLVSLREQQIIAQADETRLKLISGAKERIAAEMEARYQEHLAETKEHLIAKRVKVEEDLRRELFSRRVQLVDELFDLCAARIRSFIISEDYEPFLLKLAEKIQAAYDLHAAVISLRPEDMMFLPKLASIFPADCSFIPGEDMPLGGLLIAIPPLNLLIDERLCSRLEDSRNWFYANSGLQIDL